MTMFATQYPNNSRVVSGTPTLKNDDSILLCNTSTAPVVINLLSIPAGYWNTTWKLYVVDNSNNAAAQNITINAGSGQKINNASSITISTNGGSALIRIIDNTNFVAELNYSTSSGASLEVQDEGVTTVPVCSVMNFVGNKVTVTTPSPGEALVTINEVDTGWVDLEGFNFYSGTAVKPQCRRIGNQLFLRGVAVVPLDDPSSPGNVVPFNSSTAYNGIAGCSIFTGVGGVLNNTNGSIIFNNNNAVIPNSVVSGNLDGTYSLGYIIVSRPIDIDANYGTSLFAALNIVLTNDKKLVAATIYDAEQTGTRTQGVIGNSPLRFITSNVRAGDFLPNYIHTTSRIHNLNASGLVTLAANSDQYSDSYASVGDLQYPFSCDAGKQTEIGGFTIRLDTLKAFV